MSFVLLTGLIAAGMFAGMLLLQEVGRHLGRRHLAIDPERAGLGSVEGAIFGLLGLFLAFSFNGAASRFEARRTLIGQEVNAIGTAYRRLDLLAEAPRRELQAKFQLYLATRLEGYGDLPDLSAARAAFARSGMLQDEIWSRAVTASVAAGGAAPILLLGSINEMIDITTTRFIATQTHPPVTLYAMLGVLALVSAIPAGYAMAQRATRPVLHMGLYATALAVSLFVILDLEYPRLGLITIAEADQNLVELLDQMKGQAKH